MKILIFLVLAVSAFAKTYYVTETGTGDGSQGNPMSVAKFNATKSTAGDQALVLDTIKTTLQPNVSATALAPFVLDASAATFTPPTGALIAYLGSYTTFLKGTVIPPANVATWPNCYLIRYTNDSHDSVIDGLTVTGDPKQGTQQVLDLRYTRNITVQNCRATGVAGFAWFDGPSHDILIQNNYVLSSANTKTQTDLISYGDGYNITIQGNFLKNIAPGDGPSGRHNDVIQTYHSGSNGGNYPPPYNLVVRYNWIETEGTSGSGDMSWLMLENLNGGSSNPSAKIYSNVFVGAPDTVANNGAAVSGAGGNYYFYNNTVIAPFGRPGNTTRFLGQNSALFSANNVGFDPAGGGGTYAAWQFKAGSPWNNNWFFNWNNPSATYTGPNGQSNKNPALATNYSPLPLSPLIGAGDATLGAEYSQGIAVDAVWPNPKLVPRGSKWDVGAYQTGGVIIPPIVVPPIVVPPAGPKITSSISTTSADGKSIATVITFDKSINP